jgi:phosphate transport system substrate-binding protein
MSVLIWLEEVRHMRKARLIALIAVVAILAMSFAGVRAQGNTIVDIAAGNENFSTLVSLVQAAGLVETLSSEGPFTVFAPTNDAFTALPAEVVEYLTDPDNVDILTQILTYHVVPGRLMAADVLASESLTSVEGGEIAVSMHDMEAMVNSATITATDIEASNGVIHVISAVILPEIELPAIDPLTLTGNITSAGSSTVFPLSQEIADRFRSAGFPGNIEIASVGTGAGFERFCGPQETATDVSNASRAIRSAERENCRAQGREPLEFYVAVDALAVVVHPGLTFVDSLTLEQLAQIFSGEAATWQDVDPSWPAIAIGGLFSPGTDSGTFDYFVEEIFARDESRILGAGPRLQLSENDNVLVEGVAGTEGSIGYFGYAYYPANASRVRLVAIEGVPASAATAESGAYPLARPLFIYTTADYMREKPQVAAYVNFYLTNVNSAMVLGGGPINYFPVSRDSLNLDRLVWLAANDR